MPWRGPSTSPRSGARTERAEGRWLYAGVWGSLVGAAWVALGLLGASSFAPYFSHHLAGADGAGTIGVRLGLFVAGWTLMSVAMMLPSSLPLVTVFRTITSGAPGLMACLAAGYLGTWALFGVGAYLLDTGLHALVAASPGLAAREALIPATVLLAAGLFQFSPLKYACLRQCRSPVGFVVQRWRGGARPLQAIRLGAQHGVYCVGCCWALMLLMFGVGGIHLGWMLALGGIMFAEKAVSWGRWVSKPVGVGLAAWGLALLWRLPGVPRPF